MKGQEDENSWDFPSVFVAEGNQGMDIDSRAWEVVE